MKATTMDFARPNGAVPVAFPRSRDDRSPDYTGQYALDERDLMRQWVARTLVGLPADREHLAHGICYQAAKAEVGRQLFAPEYRLLGACVNDVLVARVALRRRNAAEAGR